MVETFKNIEGFENYSVSDYGNVRNNKTGRILKACTDRHGYKAVVLYIDKKKSNKVVHRLVAAAFF